MTATQRLEWMIADLIFDFEIHHWRNHLYVNSVVVSHFEGHPAEGVFAEITVGPAEAIKDFVPNVDPSVWKV